MCGLAHAPPAPTPPPPPPPAAKGSPNIIWFLTDDQDVVLGGSFPQVDDVGPMPKTKKLMQEQGAMAENWFIHTPICCPSRSELVTGRYYHNLKKTGGGCMHVNENLVNNQTFALYLKEAGYTVGMFGKYLNNNPHEPPAGIDAYMANGGGNYYKPQFDTQGVSDLAPYNMPDGGWTGTSDDYTTAVVGNMSLSWIRKVAKDDAPFFAYIAPKAAHEPFTPATWYADYWAPEWPAHEPRPESWNCSADSRKNHHGNIATQPMISEHCADYVTTSFKNRWRTLMSVDDVIESVISLVDELGIADNTYFMYSSDHGFQLGEFNILIDKRQMYDYDIRIHLLMRGPGIKAGSTFPFLGTNVDIAPTWLGMAGLPRPATMDGRSILPLLIDGSDANVPTQTRNHINQLAPKGQDTFIANWRDSVFIEYYYNADNAKCGGYNTEDIHNNFIGLRHMADSEFGDTSYTEYETGNQAQTDISFDAVDFVEYFKLSKDPWQMKNLWKAGDNETQSKLHTKLRTWFNCRGDTCP
jgi:N-acetylglucosamine-6-sulfatase